MIAALLPLQTATARCPECSGLTYILRRAFIRVFLFGEAVTPELVKVACPTCKGEGGVPLGTELHPAKVNANGQECCHRCGWAFYEDDFSEQCDQCGSLSRRLCETGTSGISA